MITCTLKHRETGWYVEAKNTEKPMMIQLPLRNLKYYIFMHKEARRLVQ